MSVVDAVDLLSVIFDICLLQYFLAVFFDNNFVSKKIRLPLILLGAVLYYCSSVYVDNAYLRMINYLCICFLLTFTVRGSFAKKAALILIYAIIGIVVESVAATVLVALENDYYKINREDHTELYIAGVFLSNTLILLTVVIMGLIRQKFLKRQLEQLKAAKYLFFIVLIAFCLGLFFGIHYLALTSSSVNSMYVFLGLLLLLTVFALMLFFLIGEMEHLQAVKLDNILTKEHLTAQENFYKESIARNKQLRLQVHDEKNLLLALRGLLEKDENIEAIEALNERLGVLEANNTAYTGNIALDTVLAMKIAQAAQIKATIRPAIALYMTVYVDFLDLALLAGNALDNAIEACAKLPAEETKTIYLEMKAIEKYLFITVTNPFAKESAANNSHWATTKEDKTAHGYGLKSMEQTVQKYNGKMSIDTEDEIFTLKILLENK